MTQAKVSIPDDEWEKVVKYFKKHEEKLKADGIRSATALLRHWIREGMKNHQKKIR